VPHRHPEPPPTASSPSLEETAAIVAALERFVREAVPVVSSPTGAGDPWQRTAILEGVSRDPWTDADAWLCTPQQSRTDPALGTP
jgi:hypothetical protein